MGSGSVKALVDSGRGGGGERNDRRQGQARQAGKGRRGRQGQARQTFGSRGGRELRTRQARAGEEACSQQTRFKFSSEGEMAE